LLFLNENKNGNEFIRKTERKHVYYTYKPLIKREVKMVERYFNSTYLYFPSLTYFSILINNVGVSKKIKKPIKSRKLEKKQQKKQNHEKKLIKILKKTGLVSVL
jgi:hypothetical protein